jgi:hypothetical protein
VPKPQSAPAMTRSAPTASTMLNALCHQARGLDEVRDAVDDARNQDHVVRQAGASPMFGATVDAPWSLQRHARTRSRVTSISGARAAIRLCKTMDSHFFVSATSTAAEPPHVEDRRPCWRRTQGRSEP